MKNTILLKESELKRMIDESVRRVLAEIKNRRLNEAYFGDLYHSTTLSHSYNSINEYLDKNILYPLKQEIDNAPEKYKKLNVWDLSDMGENFKQRIGYYFDKYKIFKNNWVICFTDKPYEIIKNGFLGIDKSEINALWRTFGASHIKRGYDEGYAFAYDVNDILGKSKWYQDRLVGYGTYALMFRVSGLKVHNKADNEWQVVFNNKQANLKNCFIIKCNTYLDLDYSKTRIKGLSVINPQTEKSIYKSGDLTDVINWIMTNERQYKSLNTFKMKM